MEEWFEKYKKVLGDPYETERIRFKIEDRSTFGADLLTHQIERNEELFKIPERLPIHDPKPILPTRPDPIYHNPCISNTMEAQAMYGAELLTQQLKRNIQL